MSAVTCRWIIGISPLTGVICRTKFQQSGVVDETGFIIIIITRPYFEGPDFISDTGLQSLVEW